MMGFLMITIAIGGLTLTSEEAGKTRLPYRMWTQDNPEQKGITEEAKRRPDSRNWERNLAAMAAASLICQAVTPVGYTWCVTLLTAIAAGAQEYEEQDPKENGAVPSIEKETWNK